MPTAAMLLQHGRFVRELARALLRDRHAAEDVAQEVWLQALRHPGTLATPRAWLRRAARSLASNRRRAEERRARHESLAAADEPTSSPLEESARSELLHRVVDAVFALEEPLRGTILARYFRGLDVRALAAESGVPTSTVRDRERRALELLRRRLDRATGGREAWATGLALFTPRAASLGPAGVLLVVLGVAGAALVMLAALAGSFEEPAPSAVDPAMHATHRAGAASDGAPQAPAPERASARSEAHGVAPESTSDPATELDLLVGRTLDLEGRPLAGVLLRFERARREVLRTLSDEEGRFRIEDMPAFTSVAAEHPGYRLLRATDPETDLHQPYRPMRVTLAPVGALELCVRDEDGQPLPGVRVSASPRAEERLDPASPDASILRGDSIEAETDASGCARLEDVWTGIHLALQLDLEAGADTGQVQVERALGGRLLLDRPLGGPLVVRPGRVLALEAIWGAARFLRGVVVDGRGLPVAGCRVDLEDEGYEPRENGRRIGVTGTGDDGEFTLGFRAPGLRGPIRLVAQRQGPQVPVGRNTVAAVAPCAERVEQRLTLHELSSGEPLVLRLHPTGETLLHGEVRASGGTALDWSVHELAVLGQDGQAPERIERALLGSDGAFAASSVAMALHDLVVISGCFATRRDAPVFTVLPGVLPGPPLTLTLPAESPVRLRLRGPGLSDVWIVRLLTERARGAARPGPAPIHTSAPWLAPADLAGGVQFTRVTASVASGRAVQAEAWGDGTWLVARDHARGADVLDLALGDPGWYQVRVACAGRAPLATELLHLEAGEHELVFEPPETGTLVGRLVADGEREFLGLELADEKGRRLARPQALPARGDFGLTLGAGRYRLRFGGLEELAAGRARKEVPVVVEPGLETRLELEL